jgi:hypothetical protein
MVSQYAGCYHVPLIQHLRYTFIEIKYLPVEALNALLMRKLRYACLKPVPLTDLESYAPTHLARSMLSCINSWNNSPRHPGY